ncbi:MAG: protein-glutamate O-methyltransferase CheR, partial [Spirochaetota bacterium]|nr:protein-glutamate O-methyltransferase CheR [Spirochaetota bacterium]
MTKLSDDVFNLFKDKIYQESGIHFTVVNRPILESRIRERLRQHNLDSARDYYTIINNDSSELKLLLDCVTTNLTSFFRNEAHFIALKDIVFPEIVKRKTAQGRKKLKIWSAGCSTGEEPYTIAVLALEHIPMPDSWTIEILASDISLKSLL